MKTISPAAAELQRIRKARGLTLCALAAMSGYNRKTLSRWELGLSSPTLDNLSHVAAALGLQVTYAPIREALR